MCSTSSGDSDRTTIATKSRKESPQCSCQDGRLICLCHGIVIRSLKECSEHLGKPVVTTHPRPGGVAHRYPVITHFQFARIPVSSSRVLIDAPALEENELRPDRTRVAAWRFRAFSSQIAFITRLDFTGSLSPIICRDRGNDLPGKSNLSLTQPNRLISPRRRVVSSSSPTSS